MPEPSYPDLSGKAAVVTGGSRGLGAALARSLARQGTRVVVSGRDGEAIEAVVRAIRESAGDAIGVAADVTDERAVADLRGQAEAAFGPITLLAAFAGGGGRAPVLEESADHWRGRVEANLTSTFLTIQAFAPAMAAAGGGAIVTMASAAARQPAQSSASYAAAKAGVIALTRHAAAELGERGVRLNCVSPAAIVTERLAAMPAAQREAIAASLPLRRLGETEDVAAATLFLLSAASAWITGVILDVAGGKIMV